jgi:hypothetical protein
VKPFLSAFREQKGFVMPYSPGTLIGCSNLTCYLQPFTRCDFPPWLVINQNEPGDDGDIIYDMLPGNTPPWDYFEEKRKRPAWVLDKPSAARAIEGLSPMKCSGYYYRLYY